MKDIIITDTIKYIGVDDTTLDLFEGQYIIPNGIAYNSYLILDDKVAVMDTVDARGTREWLQKLTEELDGRDVDYLIVSHMEPDHAANIQTLTERYPNMQVVGSAKTFHMIPQFFNVDLEGRSLIVKEGDTLPLGKHTLQFFMAPMVHWPEVMVTYEQSEKVLFSADGFGKFGAMCAEEEWAGEARRYYFNIVGKYGAQVQALLKKACKLDISIICSLHGPVLKENLDYYIEKYDIWSSYEPEEEGVLIAYASIYGNTAVAAHKMAEILEDQGVKNVTTADLARDDMAEVLEDAFHYSTMIIAGPTYDGGMFPCVEDFLRHLKSKNFQKRKVGIMDNGTWAPQAGKQMRALLEEMKDITFLEPMISIQSTMSEKNEKDMSALAQEIMK